jgi:hypothetical protein
MGGNHSNGAGARSRLGPGGMHQMADPFGANKFKGMSHFEETTK